MRSVDWGTAPAWLSAILTSGSLILGFYILLRDRRTTERSEASKIVCWRVWRDKEYVTHVLNAGDRVIVDVSMLVRLPGNRPKGDRYESFHVESVIKAGEEGTVMSPRGGLGGRTVPYFVTFQDADGQFWIRDLTTGELRRLSRGRPSHGKNHLSEYLSPTRRWRWRRQLPSQSIVEQGRTET